MIKLFRKWHNWLGVALSLPTLIVGLTAVFLAFEGTYKNQPNEPQVNVSWLPGYSTALAQKEQMKKSTEVRATLRLNDSVRYIGSGYGLLRISGDTAVMINEFYANEVHCLLRRDSLVWIGSQKGLYAMNLSNEKLVLLLQKDIHHIEFVEDSIVYVADNKELFKSIDCGRSWSAEEIINKKILSSLRFDDLELPKTRRLHKVILDLHTGKAFFGKTFEAIWIFLVGFSVTVLTITGLYMWYRKNKKKLMGSKESIG